ncbi:hypothetical protein TNCT_90201 [Trichonephila clavata]|uniref:Uncharacterized protein n=1 Tax=Trichonephila clavata TaxID=2740835 RepID=A0A8X6FND0_TRICU|nr:hypothetical protein TNCT_90201 [Trichonephila clavata]
MEVSPPSSFEESSGGYLVTLEKCGNSGLAGGPDGTGRIRVAKTMETTNGNSDLAMESLLTLKRQKRSPFPGLTVSNPRHCRPEVSIRLAPPPRRSNKLQTHDISSYEKLILFRMFHLF